MATRDMSIFKSFSELYDIKREDVDRLGFFDITPGVDSPLYIDAKLLRGFTIPHFSSSDIKLKKEFSKIIELVSKCKNESNDDIFYKAADKLLTFTELQGTCLGFSNNNTSGKAIGKKKRRRLLSNLKQLTDLGFVDEELMELVSVFTDGFGCDLSSDLITFMIKDIIFDYNIYIIEQLELNDRKKIKYMGVDLLENPFRPNKPIILLPKDILSELPLCFSYEDISSACAQNEDARKSLQEYIDINAAGAKERVFNLLLNDKEMLFNLIKQYKNADALHYDYETDPLCVWKFREIIDDVFKNYEGIFDMKTDANHQSIKDVSKECLSIFKHLIEDCGGRNKIQRFNEKGIQFLFFATSYFICQLNSVSLNPEVNHGKGPIDFYLTNGKEKVSIEFKKSTHPRYKHGLTSQLVDYMKANDSTFGYYAFMNYGSVSSRKIPALLNAKNDIEKEYRDIIEVVIIQSTAEESASKKQ